MVFVGQQQQQPYQQQQPHAGQHPNMPFRGRGYPPMQYRTPGYPQQMAMQRTVWVLVQEEKSKLPRQANHGDFAFNDIEWAHENPAVINMIKETDFKRMGFDEERGLRKSGKGCAQPISAYQNPGRNGFGYETTEQPKKHPQNCFRAKQKRNEHEETAEEIERAIAVVLAKHRITTIGHLAMSNQHPFQTSSSKDEVFQRRKSTKSGIFKNGDMDVRITIS
ncbi:hypothetical protein GPALN_003194 [Globodera pallida]|nr:hypothetical protein GPALN_003194 [Globodera pallida]